MEEVDNKPVSMVRFGIISLINTSDDPSSDLVVTVVAEDQHFYLVIGNLFL